VTKFNSAPLLQEDYEFTPCAEFVKRRKGTGAFFSPKFILWDATTDASDKNPSSPASIFHTAGEAHMMRALSQFIDMPNPNFTDAKSAQVITISSSRKHILHSIRLLPHRF